MTKKEVMRNGLSIMMVEKTNKLLEKKFIDEQVKLQNDIDLKNVLHLYQVSIIAGVDLAYWSVDDNEFAACCIVVLDYEADSRRLSGGLFRPGRRRLR